LFNLKIALCDDDTVELEKVQSVTEDFISKNQINHKITFNSFNNADNLLCYINKYGRFDLYILDILMPGMNGINLAAEIRKKDDNCKIIFLTSSPEFAVNSYIVGAFYYLLKPFSSEKLFSLLKKALEGTEQEKSKSIVIKETGKLTRIQMHTIRYIESEKHTILFHLQNNDIISCYGTMNEFNDIFLSDERFIKCQKSFIVNMDYVISISSRDFVLTEKELIPISRQVYQQTKNSYIDYFFKKGVRL